MRKLSVVMTHLDDYEALWFTIQNTVNELEESQIEFEIIVSDAGSEPGSIGHTRDMVKKFAEKYDIKLIEYDPNTNLLKRTIQNCPGSRTAGILKAKYDLVCFMDSHVIVKRNFFNSMIPLFDDPDVYIVYAPMMYITQLFYEYAMYPQVKNEQSTSTWEPVSEESYPVAAACNACTMIRKDYLKLFFPEDELKSIPYTMEEPTISLRAWMFGKKVLMNPKTAFAHSFFRHSGRGDFDFESIKPLAGYVFGGMEYYEKAVKDWRSEHFVLGFHVDLPEKDREFVEKNALVKYKDLGEYLISNGVKR